MKTRPYTLNTGSYINGTKQVGYIAGLTGTTLNPSPDTWYMGPDEDLGYIIGEPTLGRISSNPASSASDIKTGKDGIYWFKPSGASTAYQAYVDYNTPNGPWVHVGTAVGNTRGLYTYRATWASRTTDSGTPLSPYNSTTSSFNAGSFIYNKGSQIMIKYSNLGYVQASGFNNESWRDVYNFLNGLSAWPTQPSYNRELTITSRSGIVSGSTVTGAGLLYGTNTANGVYTNYYVYAFDSGGDTYAYLSTGTYNTTGIYNEADHGIGANEQGPSVSTFPGDDYALNSNYAFDAGTNDVADSGAGATYNNIPFSLWIKN